LKTGSSSKQGAQEILERTKVLTQKEDTTLTDPSSDHAKTQTEALIKRGEEKPLSTLGKPATEITNKNPSTEIGSPIQYVTPLQFSRGKLSTEVVFIKYIIPISAEDMPPLEFFFSNKRRVVVRREMHQRDGVTVKKYRVLLDGKALEEEDFATDVVGSLGAFAIATSFQWET
jgi:hypothetical protein